jgi:glucoamylase
VLPYIEAMLAMGNPLGLIPEQVWDSPPIPERGLAPGKPSGSAMPLVWAHSEFIKLCYGKVLGYPVDRPAATWRRYGGVRPVVDYAIWGPGYRPRRIQAGFALSIALKAPATVHWGINGWKDVADIDTRDTGLGVHVVDLPVTGLAAGATVSSRFAGARPGSGKDETTR